MTGEGVWVEGRRLKGNEFPNRLTADGYLMNHNIEKKAVHGKINK